MATTLDILNSAGKLIGVLASGETFVNNEAQDAFNTLNTMLDGWTTQNLLQYAKTVELQTLVVNQQSYLMGTGAADWSTPRPQKIEDINFIQTSGTTTLDLPIEIVNQDQWAAIAIKAIVSNLPTRVWIQYTYPYATLNFWPIPTVGNQVRIFSWKPLIDFASLTTTLSLPPGYQKALIYNLACDMAPQYGRQLDPVIIEEAVGSKMNIKRMNNPVTLMGNDPGVLPKRSTWNWFTGE